MKATWTVVVLYEKAESREAAVGFCDCLVRKYWSRCGFEVSWWSFAQLADEIGGTEAARKAALADLVIFASAAPRTFPQHVVSWAEDWLRLRGIREGALVNVQSPAGGAKPEAQCYLRELAHRAEMDYLTDVPENLEPLVAECPEFYSERAQQGSDVLREILRHGA